MAFPFHFSSTVNNIKELSNMDSNELPPLMSREEFLDHENLPPKLLALNNWLLDGNLGSNSKPDYRAYKKEHVSFDIVMCLHILCSRSLILFLFCSGCQWGLFQSRSTEPRHRGTKPHDDH